jgi:hypothetical protein
VSFYSWFAREQYRVERSFFDCPAPPGRRRGKRNEKMVHLLRSSKAPNQIERRRFSCMKYPRLGSMGRLSSYKR